MTRALADVASAYPWFFPVVAAVLGACIGSFLNVVIYRVPAGKSIVRPGSSCACGAPIAWHDNIPVLSWLVLRGRARCCGRGPPGRATTGMLSCHAMGAAHAQDEPGRTSVDLGDLIDFLGYDPRTRSIMIYMEESIGDVKKFISAARGFARNKPIVLLRPARMSDGGSPSPQSHTGYLATSDRVYDAVFKRVGVVRVKTAADLFNTAGVLYSKHLPKGPRLIVLTNAGGIGVMAINALREMGGKLADPVSGEPGAAQVLPSAFLGGAL